MVKQYEYAGNTLAYTGLIVGPDEVDVPQDQYRSPILPADPKPVVEPRPSPNVTGIPIIGQPLPTSPGNRGFTQYVLGASNVPLYPAMKTLVLSTAASYSGIPTPGLVLDRSTTVHFQDVSQLVMRAQPARSWLLLFNPSYGQAQIALGTSAVWGTNGFTSNLILGPGEAYFWSTSQQLGAAYTGAISLIGLLPNIPFWAWESAGDTVLATDRYGNIITDRDRQWIATDLPGPQIGFSFRTAGIWAVDQFGNHIVDEFGNWIMTDIPAASGTPGALGFTPRTCGPWPPSAINLAAGAVYNDGSIKGVPGIVPNPQAQPVFLDQVTPDTLLAMGCGDFPVFAPPENSGQLWRSPANGNTICVA